MSLLTVMDFSTVCEMLNTLGPLSSIALGLRCALSPFCVTMAEKFNSVCVHVANALTSMFQVAGAANSKFEIVELARKRHLAWVAVSLGDVQCSKFTVGLSEFFGLRV